MLLVRQESVPIHSDQSWGPSSVLGFLAANKSISKQDMENFVRDEEMLFCHLENSFVEAGQPIRGCVYYSTLRSDVQNTKISLTFKGILHMKMSSCGGKPSLLSNSIKSAQSGTMYTKKKPKIFTIPLLCKTYTLFIFLRKAVPGHIYRIPFLKETNSEIPPSAVIHLKEMESAEKFDAPERYISTLSVVYDISVTIGLLKECLTKQVGSEIIVKIHSPAKQSKETEFGEPKCVDFDRIFNDFRTFSFLEPILECCSFKKEKELHPIETLIPKKGIRHRGIFRMEKRPKKNCEVFFLVPKWLIKDPCRLKFKIIIHMKVRGYQTSKNKVMSRIIPVRYGEPQIFRFPVKKDDENLPPTVDLPDLTIFYEARITFKTNPKGKSIVVFQEVPFDMSFCVDLKTSKKSGELFLSQDNIEESYNQERMKEEEVHDLPFAFLGKTFPLKKGEKKDFILKQFD